MIRKQNGDVPSPSAFFFVAFHRGLQQPAPIVRAPLSGEFYRIMKFL